MPKSKRKCLQSPGLARKFLTTSWAVASRSGLTTNLPSPFSVRSIWTNCLLKSSGSISGLPNSTTPYSTYQCSTPLTHSRSQVPKSDGDDNMPQSQEEVEVFTDAVVSSLPASAQRLQMYHKCQAEDSECTRVQEHCRTGWPVKSLIEPDLLPYWKARSSLKTYKDLHLYHNRHHGFSGSIK